MPENTQNPERWLPVVGCEGIYEISDHGRVRSLPRSVPYGRGNFVRRIPGRVLVSHPDHEGRRRIRLATDGVYATRLVHVLVLEAFVGHRPSGYVACHNNGDASDNCLSNLRWDTQSSNMQDKGHHGTNPMTNRTHCPRGHALTEPNIPACFLRLGYRSCLACARARAARQQAQKKGEAFDFVAEANARYADIMGSRREVHGIPTN